MKDVHVISFGECLSRLHHGGDRTLAALLSRWTVHWRPDIGWSDAARVVGARSGGALSKLSRHGFHATRPLRT